MIRQRAYTLALLLCGTMLVGILCNGCSFGPHELTEQEKEVVVQQMSILEARMYACAKYLVDDYWETDTLDTFDCDDEWKIVEELEEVDLKYGSKELAITFLPRLLEASKYEAVYEIEAWEEWEFLNSDVISDMYRMHYGDSIETESGTKRFFFEELPRLYESPFLGVVMPRSTATALEPKLAEEYNTFYMGELDAFLLVLDLKNTEIICVKPFFAQSSDSVNPSSSVIDEEDIWKDFRKNVRNSLKASAGEIELDMDLF